MVSIVFRYYVGIAHEGLAWILGERFKEMYLSPEVAARCYSEGVRMARERYGDFVHVPSPMTPPISYIHLTTLGAILQFPQEDGEPNVRPAGFSSLDEAIEAVERPVNFADCEWVKDRIEFARRMEKILGCRVRAHLGVEGPITTAVLLYGMRFYAELIEEPERSKRLLKAITDSIVNFIKFTRRLEGLPERSSSHGICDDLSSLIGPRLWGKFVLPFWDRIYDAFGAQRRYLHCENLSEGHLPLLNRIGLSEFDPSHAPKLHPSMLKRHLKMPWRWRVQHVHVNEGFDRMKEVMEEAVENGASVLSFYIADGISPEHVRFFVRTAEGLGGKAI